jgi:adenylate cyclase, class 2
MTDNSAPPENLEIEVKFLEIDVSAVKAKLAAVGAEDLGEDLLTEIIFWDKDKVWVSERATRSRFVRLRRNRKGTFLTYKSLRVADDYAEELETKVGDMDIMTRILEAVGLIIARRQEKQRHTFHLDNVVIDIDTWPGVPTYIELEGQSEPAIKAVAEKLGFAWDNGVFDTAAGVIEKIYKLPIHSYKYFTFNKIE